MNRFMASVALLFAVPAVAEPVSSQWLEEDFSSLPPALDFFTFLGPEFKQDPAFKIFAEKNRAGSPVIELKNAVLSIQGKPACRLVSRNGLEFSFDAITTECPVDAAPPCEKPLPCESLKPLFIPYGRQGTSHAIPVQAVDEKSGFVELAQIGAPRLYPHALFLDLESWTSKTSLVPSPNKIEAMRKKEIAPFANDPKLKKWITDTRACFDRKDIACLKQRMGNEIDSSQIFLFSWENETPFACASLNQEKKKPSPKLRVSEIFPCLWNTPSDSLSESERILLDAFTNCLSPEAINDQGIRQLRFMSDTDVLVNNACLMTRDKKGDFKFLQFSSYGC